MEIFDPSRCDGLQNRHHWSSGMMLPEPYHATGVTPPTAARPILTRRPRDWAYPAGGDANSTGRLKRCQVHQDSSDRCGARGFAISRRLSTRMQRTVNASRSHRASCRACAVLASITLPRAILDLVLIHLSLFDRLVLMAMRYYRNE